MYFRKRKIKKSSEKKDLISSIRNITKKYYVIKNILLLLSIVSVNFAAYIAYYDINIFMMIDSSAIIKYTFGLLILFAFVAALTTLMLLFIEKYIFLPSFFHIGDEKRVSSIFNLLRYPLIILIFSCIYIGWLNTIKIFFVFIFYFGVIYIVEIFNDRYFKIRHKNKINIIAFIKNTIKIRNFKEVLNNINQFFKDYFALIIDYFKFILKFNPQNFELKHFIFSKFGFMFLLLALLLGIGRASFVNNRFYVKLNTSNEVYVLFLNTTNGIFLFDKNKDEVFYTANDKIKKLVFLKDSRRSLIF